jgi:hypothetical protein
MDEQADFVAKLREIEQAALVGGSDLKDGGPSKSHFRHIALLARTLRSRLEMGLATVAVTAQKPPPNSEGKKRPA